MEYLACLLIIVIKTLKGFTHRYDYRKPEEPNPILDKKVTVFGFTFKPFGIHETDWTFSAMLGLLALMTPANLLQVIGASLVAMVPFQWVLNLSLDRGMFEVESSTERWSAFGIEWIRIFSGKNLYRVGLPAGIIIFLIGCIT